MAGKPEKKFSTLRIYAEYIPIWLLCKLARAVSLKTAYRISAVVIAMMRFFDVRHRHRTEDHLIHAGLCADRKSARKIGKEVFRQFGMLGVEIFKADQLFDLNKVRVVGDPESAYRCFGAPEGERQNVIVTTAHYGNWEIAGGAFSALSKIPMTSIMRPFANPKIGELILRNRRTAMHTLVLKEGGIRPILKALRSRHHVAILVDQHAGENESAHTYFFGHPCRTHFSPALLHLKTGVPILPELTRRVQGDEFAFEIVVGKMIEYQPTGDQAHDLEVISQMYTSELEQMIREQPEQWLWAHRRWLDINRHPYDLSKFPPPPQPKH